MFLESTEKSFVDRHVSYEPRKKGLQPVCLTSDDTWMPNIVSSQKHS